ncbi:MAG: arginine--tRNA ligase [Candidatus Eremiobacteraeota bacterium]|nr:arginine--tRNA ligase [Candidatus Eremiobacteraeota bacterium]
MISHQRRALRRIKAALEARLATVAAMFGLESAVVPDVVLTAAREAGHGDFATAAALAAGKAWHRNPMHIAQAVAAAGADELTQVAEVHAAAPGFVNLRMQHSFWADVLREALARGADYGKSDILQDAGPVLIEFSSANPTGPLLVVQGRSCSLGATLVAMLRFAGAQAHAETYLNDAGAQLDLLADSIFARYATACGVDTPLPVDGYAGDYVIDIALSLKDRDGDSWLRAEPLERRAAIGAYGRDRILCQQREDMERFGVRFDRWFSESALHSGGLIDDVISQLQRRGEAYLSEGAVWLRSTRFGDDKDRVLRRSDGRPTYLAADAAYHREKLERGNKLLIDILGPDHHGYVARLKAIVAALGYPGAVEVLLAQQVTLKRGDEVVAMSKRAGNVLTLREVLDEVGVDAARFFFVSRAPESPLVFDIRLAVEQSANNPVYYVQYGHARIASIIRRAIESARELALSRAREGADVALLDGPAEIALIRRLAAFDAFVADAAKARAPHRLTEYARDVATGFHSFYTECVVLSDDEALTSARLSLCFAAQAVLGATLSLLGVTAPQRM